MKATNMLRIATADTAGVLDSACSEVEMAVGLPVRPELQEIENGCLWWNCVLVTHMFTHRHPPDLRLRSIAPLRTSRC